ncbi:MAG: response regulator receiver protein [Paenibacillus sp.]|jgi:two-component system chemotaxis response regulator CheY|nr:response regulator receiver protein [Paenibacillus sp.]
MYSIGELSKIVKISVDALRYYDEIGLLKPHHIHPTSRYRYYSADQVQDMMTIMELKQLGFSLDAIQQLLACSDEDQLTERFRSKMQQLIVERGELDKSIQLLQQRLRRLGEATTLSKKTVLVIDDAAFMRHVLTDILEKNGYHVIGAAANGESGIAKHAECQPDIVILDIGMPGMDGIEALQAIRRADPRVSIVMCSAQAQPQKVLRSAEEGANDFIVKPFHQQSLLQALENKADRKYESDAIAAALASVPAEYAHTPLSQPSISQLLQLCAESGAADSLAVKLAEFWSLASFSVAAPS